MVNSQTLLERCYKNKQGKVTISQVPNLPLIAWIISALLARIITEGPIHNFFEIVSFGTIFTWAWMEIFSGESYFRRIIGFIVMATLIINRS